MRTNRMTGGLVLGVSALLFFFLMAGGAVFQTSPALADDSGDVAADSVSSGNIPDAPTVWIPMGNRVIRIKREVVLLVTANAKDGRSIHDHYSGELQVRPKGYLAQWERRGRYVDTNGNKSSPPPVLAFEETPKFYGLPETYQPGTPLDPAKIHNLVFSGGGIKGLAYGGAVQGLQELSVLPNVYRFAGASAGAITAGLLAVGFSPTDIQEEVAKKQFGELLDSWGGFIDLQKMIQQIRAGTFDIKDWRNILRLIDILTDEYFEYGICQGEAFTKWMTELFVKKGFDNTTTFQQLYLNNGNELYVVMCNANYGKTVIANHVDTPDMPIIDAIRISMSIPFVFSPKVYKGDYYVDGGTMYNYPIDIFDKIDDRDTTLGFVLSTADSIFNPPRKEIGNVLEMMVGVFGAIMNVSYQDIFRANNQDRTVFIDCGTIGALDFKLTTEQQTFLIQNGLDATRTYFGLQN